ncbi:MAG: IreB family regulatory phosphoprotein [Clostridia bacterium]|nr:IreB family regulatory phosphoprotein [Clostridia bacterium]MBR3974613.1 IreB family regulatory phosphoprotein [Clostridia bacterium]
MSDKTRQFNIGNQNEEEIRKVILTIYNSLVEKGYNPISQIVGYILSEDPTYITTHNNARSLIRRIDRFELLQILLKEYINNSEN